MKYKRSIEAMFKAGRVRATSVTADQVKAAERYINLAVARCEEEKPPIYLAQAAYNDGLKGLKKPTKDQMQVRRTDNV